MHMHDVVYMCTSLLVNRPSIPKLGIPQLNPTICLKITLHSVEIYKNMPLSTALLALLIPLLIPCPTTPHLYLHFAKYCKKCVFGQHRSERPSHVQ